MKQKGQTTFIFITAGVIVILIILISVTGFFIISKLTHQTATISQTEPTAANNQNTANQSNPTTSTSAQSDLNHNGIPDNVEKNSGSNVKPPITTPVTSQSAVDANHNGIPDNVEKNSGNTQK